MNKPIMRVTRIDILRKEANKLGARIYKINGEIGVLENEKRRKELEQNVGKCFFVKSANKTLDRYCYVIGVGKHACNEVLSIVSGGRWMQFERQELSLDSRDWKKIPRAKFASEMKKLAPFFKQALRCSRKKGKPDIATSKAIALRILDELPSFADECLDKGKDTSEYWIKKIARIIDEAR